MKKNVLIISILALAVISMPLRAQDDDKKKEDVYQFTMEKQVPVTSVKDQ